MTPLILFWSQNPDLYLLYSHILATEGFRSALADEGDLVEQAARGPALAVLLDTEADVERALRICGRIKTEPETARIPVLALVPGGNAGHCLALLKAGVDENFIRPTSPARILAYLQSLVAGVPQSTAAARGEAGTFNVWELTLDPGRRLVRHGAEERQLSPIEFRLLCRLLQAPGRVHSRGELIAAVWPASHYVQPRTVDVHVGRLRRMLRQMTGRDIIRTVRSTGYAVEFAAP